MFLFLACQQSLEEGSAGLLWWLHGVASAPDAFSPSAPSPPGSEPQPLGKRTARPPGTHLHARLWNGGRKEERRLVIGSQQSLCCREGSRILSATLAPPPSQPLNLGMGSRGSCLLTLTAGSSLSGKTLSLARDRKSSCIQPKQKGILAAHINTESGRTGLSHLHLGLR